VTEQVLFLEEVEHQLKTAVLIRHMWQVITTQQGLIHDAFNRGSFTQLFIEIFIYLA
jgi:hypothetical protein